MRFLRQDNWMNGNDSFLFLRERPPTLALLFYGSLSLSLSPSYFPSLWKSSLLLLRLCIKLVS